MKEALVALLLFFGLTGAVRSQSPARGENYLGYHDIINRAEHLFFMDGEVDAALACYDSVFAAYDYVFIRDLLNAAQISVHAERERHRTYLLRAFAHGFQFHHFRYFSLFDSIAPVLRADSAFVKVATNNRERYVANINYAYLSKVYDLVIVDQLRKGDKPAIEAIRQRRDRDTIRSWIEVSGFPGAKVLGINDPEAFAAIGKPRADFGNRVARYPRISHFILEKDLFALKLPMVVLVHNKCAFDRLKDLLWDSMLKGEVHPREIGLLYDNAYRFEMSRPVVNDCEMPPAEDGLFRLNPFLNYNQYELTDAAVNRMRTKWYVGKIEVDRKKQAYTEQYGFKARYGFWWSL